MIHICYVMLVDHDTDIKQIRHEILLLTDSQLLLEKEIEFIQEKINFQNNQKTINNTNTNTNHIMFNNNQITII